MEIIVQIFRKIIQFNAVSISTIPNEYCKTIISKSGLKMDLYPAMSIAKFLYIPELNNKDKTDKLSNIICTTLSKTKLHAHSRTA